MTSSNPMREDKSQRLLELEEIIPIVGERRYYGSELIQLIMNWHLRWAGRPTKEQIARRLWDNYKVNQYFDNHCVDELANGIFTLYSPAPKVPSREEIARVLSRYGRDYDHASATVIELLALFTEPRKEPVAWCFHIYESDSRWWMATDILINGKHALDVSTFKFCPICSAPRPTEAK